MRTHCSGVAEPRRAVYAGSVGQGDQRASARHPENGCLHVYGVGDDGVNAFTKCGIECLRQIIADERKAGSAPQRIAPTS